jgi:hypothetical protein
MERHACRSNLTDAGIRVDCKRVARLMLTAGLAGVSRRRNTVTTVRDGARQAPISYPPFGSRLAAYLNRVRQAMSGGCCSPFDGRSETPTIMRWRRVSSPRSNVSCSIGADSTRRPRRALPSSNSSRASTIRGELAHTASTIDNLLPDSVCGASSVSIRQQEGRKFVVADRKAECRACSQAKDIAKFAHFCESRVADHSRIEPIFRRRPHPGAAQLKPSTAGHGDDRAARRR